MPSPRCILSKYCKKAGECSCTSHYHTFAPTGREARLACWHSVKFAIGIGNGVSMWGEFRVAPEFIEPVYQLLRSDMLRFFGHFMHFIPGKF